MGWGAYSESNRMMRATSAGYYTKSRDEVFAQTKLRQIHASMNPHGVKMREACDSAEHPNVTPIQLYLDETGSMREIPHEMIKDGLPTLVGSLLQNGVSDVAVLFCGIGDHECDHAPLQIGQFESGDKEMDMWLERVYLEGNGGGNSGESYLLAWYFAGYHTRTDSFEKRGKKGFVFTIGDEPTLMNLPASAVKEIMGNTSALQATATAKQLLEKAQEANHVYHIHINHGRPCVSSWRDLLGQHLIEVDDHRRVSETISNIVLSYQEGPVTKPSVADETKPSETTIIL